MTKSFRPYKSWNTVLPLKRGSRAGTFDEAMSDKLSWLTLRQLSDVPDRGLALFSGTRPERKRLHTHFRSYVRQAQAYWVAGNRTQGSASALLYYYAALNLAKAELLQTNPNEIIGKSIHHGLSAKLSEPTSLRGDRLTAPRGIFPLLFEKRTGSPLPQRMQFPIVNVLSLLPEIAHEMNEYGRTRPPSRPGFLSVAADDDAAWATIGLPTDIDSERREPVIRRLLSAYEPVEGSRAWRSLFALSSRWSRDLAILQSKTTFSTPPQPDHAAALSDFLSTVGDYISSPHDAKAEFMLTYTLRKSDPFFLSLPLARYAALFYMSSVVRYKPASLDPVREGEQAWLADSFSMESPTHLLADFVESITGELLYFEPGQWRV